MGLRTSSIGLIRPYRPTKRADFLVVLAIYQLALAVRYLDLETYTVSRDQVFSWTHVFSPWSVSILLTVSATLSIIAAVSGRMTKLAFSTTMLSFSILCIVWIGSMVFTGHWAGWATVVMYVAFVWIVWLSAGIVDTPRKMDKDE